MTEAPAPAHPLDGCDPIDLARDLFFRQGREATGIAEPIARSWLRSRHLPWQHHQLEPITLGELDERREQSLRLLACAQPELDGLAEHAAGNGCVVILTDPRGLILHEIGSPDFLPKAERIALKPGVEWSEGLRGTNAIGMALVERHAVMVLGGEHYLAPYAQLGCAAAPILDGRGAVAGVLDISGDTQRVNQHALGLVRMSAQQVEHRMLLAGAQGHVLRFHARPSLIGTPREAMLVITDGRIAAANRLALELFDSDWLGLLDRDIRSLLGRDWGRLEHQRGLLTLPGGRQIAGVVERLGAPLHAAPRRRADEVQDIGPDADPLAPLLAKAARVLDQGVPVLVTGETGSGKDVFARRLHAASRRSAGPFVALDCASLPENLIEAELFGYEDGAFTGARKRGSPGRVREADGGILFLDEIGEMPLGLQSRLLRVLENRVVVPLGGGRPVPVDFDLVCATHQSLEAMVQAGRFRADLMYRLAGFTASLPALRERADRRALIARLFDELGGRQRRLRLCAEALDRLAAHSWPGNVRELRSVLKSLVALAEEGDALGLDALPAALCAAMPAAAAPAVPAGAVGRPAAATESLRDATRSAIAQALEATGNDVAQAARLLGVHRSTVYRHLARQQP
ncbi:sigma-54-dependent Fis family transcriptional regulator [Pseudorhodoferax soli]|uniref:Transcriptional regulator of acetoin/glycerol metabolism n=1 Tax=Pseudorhodoferax soli TaxID=545864 RepID=A0A368XY34_9BURK|nr:sigma-54-dependent Fis family transcriptional regulator [Pseudorhodoferax soli]RCW72882.1 transcriptional regulator of acetoin/glycerol metabolism [Pseudorhodoferax soli]